MAAVAARSKRRLSSFAVSILLSARARARRPETQAPRGAWVSAPRLERKGDPSVEPAPVAVFVSNQPSAIFMFGVSCGTLRVVGRVIARFKTRDFLCEYRFGQKSDSKSDISTEHRFSKYRTELWSVLRLYENSVCALAKPAQASRDTNPQRE